MTGPSSKNGLRLEISCELGKVRAAAEAVRGYLSEQGCGESEVIAAELALVEACNNAIEYVDPAERGKPVVVEVCCSSQELLFQVTDHTPGFDLPERAPFPGPDQESGRGIPLIQSLMDEVRYLRQPTGNVLVMRKNRQ